MKITPGAVLVQRILFLRRDGFAHMSARQMVTGVTAGVLGSLVVMFSLRCSSAVTSSRYGHVVIKPFL